MLKNFDMLHAILALALALAVIALAFAKPSCDEVDTYIADRMASQCAAYHEDVISLLTANAILAQQVKRLEATMRPLMEEVQ